MTVRRPLLPTAVLACTLAAAPTAYAAPEPLADRLAGAYRTQMPRIDLVLDYHPARDRVRGRAELALTLRPGQSRVLFHFNPLRAVGPAAERRMLGGLRIDGERLDPRDPDDLRRVRGRASAEPAWEVRRDFEPGSAHTLVVRWTAPTEQAPPGWLFPKFDDTEGPLDETETMWPTISSPEVLARHRIGLRVHSRRPYTVVGSGRVTPSPSGGDAQAWRLDTGVRVSSSNVFFAAVPTREVTRTRVRARGVDVLIVSDRPARVVAEARRRVRATISTLTEQLGPFPMPTMAILLTGWGSGMEYYGATRTGMRALRHELAHMYFGVTTVNRTWRDTWIDESAVVWREGRRVIRPVPEDFRSDLATDGRSAVEPGFDTRAYGEGAQVLARIARIMGGDRQMLQFLADLHRRRAFAPFTTRDLIDDLLAAEPRLDRADLERWLLGRVAPVS